MTAAPTTNSAGIFSQTVRHVPRLLKSAVTLYAVVAAPIALLFVGFVFISNVPREGSAAVPIGWMLPTAGISIAFSGIVFLTLALFECAAATDANRSYSVRKIVQRFTTKKLINCAIVMLLSIVVVLGLPELLRSLDHKFTSAADRSVMDSIVGSIPYFFSFLLIVILMLKTSMVFPCIVNEDSDALTAFRRSWILSQGEEWRVLGILLLATLFFQLANLLFSAMGRLMVWAALAMFGGPQQSAIHEYRLPLASGGSRLQLVIELSQFAVKMTASFFAMLIFYPLLTVLYRDLRQRKGEYSEAPAASSTVIE